jgi:hypothetical protein
MSHERLKHHNGRNGIQNTEEFHARHKFVSVLKRLIKLNESNLLAAAAFPQPEQNAEQQLAALIALLTSGQWQ